MTNMIHLVDGEKGGVGKSMLTRILVEFNQKYELLYTLIDGDFQNPDVQQRYPEHNAKIVALVEDEEKFFDIDIIFETAVETPVIVNLPARVYSIINKWIDEANLTSPDFKEQSGVDVCKWFICGGTTDSIEMFIDSFNYFEGQLNHIFVRNFGVCKDWSHVQSHKEMNKLINNYRIPVVDLPALSARERKFIDTKRLSFSQAMKHSEFFLISQQRLHTFMEDCFRLIEDVGLFNNAPNRNKKEVIGAYERKINEEMQIENEQPNE
jgi:hypothetical protein